MAFRGSARKKLWHYGLSWQQYRAPQNCAWCLNVAVAWQHPQPWQGIIAPCKFTSLIFSQVFQACRCNTQVSVRAFGKLFVLSMLTLRDLMPFKPCRRLLLFPAKLLLPHAHFHCLLPVLCRGVPPPPCSCPQADPSTSPNWPSSSVPHADAYNLTQAHAIW